MQKNLIEQEILTCFYETNLISPPGGAILVVENAIFIL